jgi:uncharacterized DUF497 family protein
MRFEWDKNKNRENLQKHGFDFADARELFENTLLVKTDTRHDYGEDRWIGIGMLGNGIVAVLVFTKRDHETIRIISMRKASKRERKYYEKNVENRLGKN